MKYEDDYFFNPQVLDLKKLYIIGYLITDGCIRGNRVSLTTTEKDKDNLYDIHQYLPINTTDTY